MAARDLGGEKTMAALDNGGREAREMRVKRPSFCVLLVPRNSRGHLFFAGFFRISLGGLNERETTH